MIPDHFISSPSQNHRAIFFRKEGAPSTPLAFSTALSANSRSGRGVTCITGGQGAPAGGRSVLGWLVNWLSRSFVFVERPRCQVQPVLGQPVESLLIWWR